MKIPTNEQETVINLRRNEGKAIIYTSDTLMMSKLHRLHEKNSHDWICVKKDTDSMDHDVVSETWECPKNLISFKAMKRTMTEEQRQAAAERLKRMREKKA